MKDWNLLVWLTQLGFSVGFPLAGFTLLAVWLHKEQHWGQWVIWVGVGLGFLMAIEGFRSSLKVLERITRKSKDKAPPPVSFNDHD